MFGHLFDNTYTGTRAERGVRNWTHDKYDRARRGASNAYNTASEYGSALRNYLPGFSSRQQGRQERHHGYTMDAAGGLCCFLTGAALMYFFDPQMGRRRRALVRDKFIRAGHATTGSLSNTGQYLRDRSRGLYYETARKLRSDHPTDEVLCQRVRSRLGRVTSHPSAICVSAFDGCVTLSGPILADECSRVISAINKVPGVCEVVDRLEPHETAENIPALQGESRTMASEAPKF